MLGKKGVTRALGTLQKGAFKLHPEGESKYLLDKERHHAIYYFKGNEMYPIEALEKDNVVSD